MISILLMLFARFISVLLSATGTDFINKESLFLFEVSFTSSFITAGPSGFSAYLAFFLFFLFVFFLSLIS